MGRPPGKTFPISVMVKTTAPMKARLEALAARTPFDVAVGFSVVARRAIAIGLEVLERDPRLIVEPTEGDAVAALAVLSDAVGAARTMRRIEDLQKTLAATSGDPSGAAVEAAMHTLGVIPLQDAQGGAISSAVGGEVLDGDKGPPQGAQERG